MVSIKQALKLGLFAAAIVLVLNFAWTTIKDNLHEASSSPAKEGIYENASGAFGAYSKMAQLSFKAPDEHLLMPVKGVRVNQIADTWGAPRSGGRMHAGQDIFAKKGTPVYSTTEGYVLRVGETDLGGKNVFIYGAGGRRYYYAHLDEFAPDLKAGDAVSTDTLIGYVGATGNAKGTPPHLHFGIYGGGAVNPLILLRDRS
jgi:murein DD-endopeptidase MepM/ murein hydrolase activator NlpD